MKKLAFALLGVVTALSTACASGINSNQAVDDSANISDAVSVDTALEPTIEGPTPQVVDWDGRWSGVIPCATCPGIDVDLIFNKDGTFWMKEKHVDSVEAAVLTKGTLKWNENTRILTLSSPKRDQKLLFSESSAVYLDKNGSPLPEYELHKQAEYRALGQQLILPLQSIRVEGNYVLFSGLLNFKDEQDRGFKSVEGEAVIDCAKQHVAFKDASYYSQIDALGERIVNVSQQVMGGWSLSKSTDESVFAQVADTFCPKF